MMGRNIASPLAPNPRALLAVLMFAGLGCSEQTRENSGLKASQPETPTQSPIELIDVPADTLDAKGLIKQEQKRALADERDLLVYVGATWCEPCERFKKAAHEGELDEELAGLRLLVFDRDTHDQALRDAGCLSKMIPLFAKAEEDGTCSELERIAGGIKGPGATKFLTPKVKRLLGR